MTETNKLDILVEQLGQLTVVEAGQLAKQLEKEWDLDLANLTAGAPAAAAPVDAGKTEFNVVLTGFDSSKKINVLKAIKTIKGIGLMEAKQFVEGDMPATVDTDVAKDQAEKFKKEIEDAGGQVELK
jgi:large subunit ribosomal protein L7/L12